MGNLVCRPEREPMRGTVQQPRVEKPFDIFRRHRAVGNPATLSRHLDERLEPEHASRAIPHELNLEAARGRLSNDGVGHLIGADRTSGRVERYEDDHRVHLSASDLTRATSSSKRPSSTLPLSRRSTITAGERTALGVIFHDAA